MPINIFKRKVQTVGITGKNKERSSALTTATGIEFLRPFDDLPLGARAEANRLALAVVVAVKPFFREDSSCCNLGGGGRGGGGGDGDVVYFCFIYLFIYFML